MGPHFHHFPFATRILRGSYANWFFDNDGTIESPQLRPGAQGRCETGDVYTIPYDRYHCVLTPAADTMSLMIRGRQRIDREGERESGYGREEILERRARMIRVLEPQPPAQGRRAQFQTFAQALAG